MSRASSTSNTANARNVRARLGRERLDELVARYVAGSTTPQLMAEFGLSRTAVLSVLRRASVEVRRQPITSKQIASAQRLYEGGLSLVTVARQLGLARESVRRALVEAGVAMRPRGGRQAASS